MSVAWCTACTPKGIRIPNPDHGGDNDKGNHGCGIYALKVPFTPDVTPWHEVDVVGQVALWGRVILATKGYRAECAYPTRLIVPSDMSIGTVKALEEYGIPVDVWPVSRRTLPVPNVIAPVPPPATTQRQGRTKLGIGMYHWWTAEFNPMPNTRYKWQMPLGHVYRTIEISGSAENIVTEFSIIVNGSFQISRGPLSICARTSAGNFILYDGLRDNTQIDSRAVMYLEVEVQTLSVIATKPILLGYLAHA